MRVSKLCVSRLWNRFEACFGPSGSGIAVTATILFCSLVSGCATNPTAAVPPPPSIDGYALVGADVTVSEDAWTGRFGRLDGMDEVEFAKRVEEELESALVEAVADSFTGEHSARIVVHVDEMNVATGVGKALLFKRSRLGGVVRVVDTDTEETVAEARLSEREQLRAPLESDSMFEVSSTAGGSAGVGGAWVELAGHISEDRVANIAREFAWRVRLWLNSGRLEEQQPPAE